MTARVRQMLLTLVSGSALALAPMAFATVITPAASNADECTDGAATADGQCCDREAKPQGVTCKDGQIADEQNGKCLPLLDGISKQLQALPPPPSLSGFGGGGGGGGGGIGGLGFPNLGTIYMPDLVLPSFGIDLVPDLSVNPDLGLGGAFAGAAPNVAPNLAQLPAPQLPPPPDLTKLPSPQLPAVNPLNPLGLPPPPDLTPGIPLI